MPPERPRATNLDYDGFRRLARDPALSPVERIGFPDEYRAGYEDRILDDIVRKLPALSGDPTTVVDIGPGCSELPRRLLEFCSARGHELVLIDSPEMLNQLPDGAGVRKVAGRFPDECEPLIDELDGRAGVVLSYSVLHHVFGGASVFGFFDAALTLLRPGGHALFGDVPNASKRRRFFASERGRAFHRAFTGRDEDPPVTFNVLERDVLDDAAVLALVARGRGMGFDTYLVPQNPELPMANRREDLLVARP